jgi:PAS domain S-box-containing protein
MSNSRIYRPPRALTPYLVLAAGLLFTFVVSYRLSTVAEAEDRARFLVLVQQIHSSIEGRLETYEALLRAGTGLFAVSESVQRREFREFVKGLGLPDHYPGIQGIGFSIRLKPAERAALEETRRREGISNFRIWPEFPRSEYHSIIYLEPLNQRNQAALGFDMFTEAVRRAAMERARDTGLPAASGRVTLVQEINLQNKPAGFLIYTPVYRNSQKAVTESERREALLGFVYSPFRVDDFLNEIVSKPTYESVSFNVYDGAEQKPENLLHRSTSSSSPEPVNYEPRFSATTKLDVAGRPWTLTYASRPGFDLTSGRRSWVPYILTAGVLISFLFFAVTYSQTRARAKAERSESEVRESEATVRTILAGRERAEEALRESEERYRELVENANDIVYTLDLEGKMTSVNKAAEAITGYSRAEMLNMNLVEIMTPESVEASRQMLNRKLSGEEKTNYELDIRAKDGRILTLEISSRLVSKQGEAAGIQGVARDISARRRAEEVLREADQRALSEYERLLERISGLAQGFGTARDLVTIFRALREFTLMSVPCDGLFISMYDHHRDVRTACYGWGDGREFDTSDLPPMPITTAGPNSRAIRTGQVIITNDYMNAHRGHQTVIVGPDNGMRPECSLAVPMAVMGRIIGTIEVQSYRKEAFREEHATAMRMASNLTAVAIENVRLLERESTARAVAEDSNRLKDEFLATVSHELRTPLTAILGWARMLEGGSLDTVVASRAIETIRRNAKSQSQIIDDILDVSRIITGKLYLDLHPIELAPVIEAAVNVVRPTAEAKGIQIEVKLEPRPSVITGDANRLQQVIWNLLSNAIKFTPGGGRVSVSIHQMGTEVEIKVADNGQGINRSFLPYVFDRFRQADSTSTRQHGGLGLGLAIARHLIEIHGGTIYAESAGEKRGATFSIRLPLIGTLATVREPERIEAKHAAFSKAELNGIHVLLVDDDEDTLDLLTQALTQQAATVTAVSTASEALEAIKSLSLNVVVSDIAMPDEDGYQLIRQIRELDFDHGKSLPVVAITAYAKEEDRRKALSSGFQGFLSKPIELSELIMAVADAVRVAKHQAKEPSDPIYDRA